MIRSFRIANAMEFEVGILCNTFNQAGYIEDALGGFCSQNTEFPFICIIVDDASTDEEPSVIKQFLSEHFNLEDDTTARTEETDDYVSFYTRHKTNLNCYFAVYLLKYNHFGKKSKRQYYREWIDPVKYIALCEGDDYWIDSNKLQYQVGFLKTHPEYGFVGTKTRVLEPNGLLLDDDYPSSSSPVIEGDWILYQNVFEDAKFGPVTRTVSICYKKAITDCFPDKVGGDLMLQTVLAKYSYYALFNRVMAVYRNNVGVSSINSSLEKQLHYNNWYVKNRRLQREFFPEECNWDENELLDRVDYIRLKIMIRDMNWKEAVGIKRNLRTDQYKKKKYSRYLHGPISCFLLSFFLRNR